MIDVVAVLVVVLIAAGGARYVEKDNKEDRHTVFCIGLCSHQQQKQEPVGPEDPNDPKPEE